jgi:carbonic anhydrase
MIPAQQALARLREGNRRFVAGTSGNWPEARPSAVQQPFAIVLGCSDARVPAELIFAQGFGDLFVIRVAGNIVAPSQVGSVEFAAERFETRLAVVLGHTQCGAVAATLEALHSPDAHQSPNLRAIVDRIRPSVAPLLATPLARDEAKLAAEAVRANVRASVHQLRHGSALLEQRIARDGLMIVGAEYSVESGVVEFFD